MRTSEEIPGDALSQLRCAFNGRGSLVSVDRRMPGTVAGQGHVLLPLVLIVLGLLILIEGGAFGL
ncbi:hypothetical protein [Streptomyces sp. NPDC000851]